MDLVVVLSLAACGAQTIHPQPPPDLPPVKTAPEPIPVPAPEPEPAPKQPEATPPPAPEPLVESKPEARVAPKPAVLPKKCNPMSRAGCRWNEERDEREAPRITKKPAPAETR